MPELPEVETIARGLAKRVSGEIIDSVWIGSKPEPLKSSAAEIVRTLEGARIANVRRVGKHIVFDLDRNDRNDAAIKQKNKKRSGRTYVPTLSQWIVHLGMTGRLLISTPE